MRVGLRSGKLLPVLQAGQAYQIDHREPPGGARDHLRERMCDMRAVLASLPAADRDILQWFVAHRSAEFTALAKALMDLALSVVFLGVVLLVTLIAAVVLRAFRPVVAGGGAALLAVAASLVLKQLIARPRPDAGLALIQAAGYSMPSTDAALVAALTTAAVLAVRWSSCAAGAAAAVAVAANLLTGLALVYLGVHWTTDVLAGWTLGGVIGVLVGMLARRRPPIGLCDPAIDSGRP